MCFDEALPSHPKDIHHFFVNWSPTNKYDVYGHCCRRSLLVLQSAGGRLPGIGYFFSPFATVPILLGALDFISSRASRHIH